MTEVTIDGHIGELMTVEEFKQACIVGALIDYDGMGDLVKDGKIITPPAPEGSFFPKWVYPSRRHEIPEDVTHILWYNK